MAYDVKRKYERSSQDCHLERKQAETDRNEGVFNSPHFEVACRFAGIEKTRRQASKFAKGRGLAKNPRGLL